MYQCFGFTWVLSACRKGTTCKNPNFWKLCQTCGPALILGFSDIRFNPVTRASSVLLSLTWGINLELGDKVLTLVNCWRSSRTLWIWLLVLIYLVCDEGAATIMCRAAQWSDADHGASNGPYYSRVPGIKSSKVSLKYQIILRIFLIGMKLITNAFSCGFHWCRQYARWSVIMPVDLYTHRYSWLWIYWCRILWTSSLLHFQHCYLSLALP